MIFKIGSRGDDVRKIQQTLKRLGHPVGKIDGIFGSTTKIAVVEFQIKNKLNADGVVGPITWEKLLPDSTQHIPELVVPSTREEVYQVFGDPLDSGYWKAYGGFCETPPELNHVFTYQKDGKNGFWCNKLLVPLFQNAYQAIVQAELSSKLYSFDGCYNLRNSRGTKKLSMHSWGIAVDHNAKTNPLGANGDMDYEIVEIFESEGFYWGGNFKRKDPMHFEFTEYGA